MKIKNLLLILLLIISGNVFSQTADDEITFWINNGDYLQLKQRYQEEKGNIKNPTVKLMAEAFISTAFNKPDEAIKKLSTLITNHQESLGLNGITTCVALIAENLRYQGKYLSAADMLINYVNQTDSFDGLDENTRTIFLSQCALVALGDLMKPEIERPAKNCTIPIIEHKDFLQHAMYVNANLNGKDVPFLFDTGCEGYSTNMVTEKFARENNIKIINDSVVVYGITNGVVKLGKAERMRIGEIVYKNVAFIIAPGDNLLPVDTLQLDAVLGSVFIKAMAECQIYPQKKEIVFPLRQSALPSTGSNMMLKGGQPYIEAFSNEERLLLHFDTGSNIGLSSKYFVEHEEEIEANGKLKKGGGIGGFGGVKYINTYTLNNFPIQVGGNNVTLPQIDVFTNDGLNIDQYDGSLGADFIRLHNKVTINFDKMFAVFE
ncbi:retropepsin-like aspartic protease [Bacteroides sp. 519]|uniref:retropepsin-like aspartic protease n=1 Tax=Bacteroides sp. 519 TaxID=2302937 RepID=UPI0013D0311E|nr:retropepsin-like aspartic protease [Bacteroides sp. 519]NDV59650.1 hypothetical protein [Bacteroides sp. 519]